MKRYSGFTLIEVLISLTIIGLLFGFGFVSFRDFSRRQAVVSAGRAVIGDLRLAQSKALSGEKPASCNGANTLSSYSFQIINSISYKVVANCLAGNVDIKIENLPDGISMSPASGTISFKVLGQGTNITAGGSFVITLTQAGTNNTSLVTVTSGGEIK